MSKVAKWIVGGVVGLVVLVVGGTFVFIHFVEGPPKKAFSLSDAPVASTSATSSSTGTDGTYTVAAGSQAGYRVKEILFGQSTTAVGRTSDITGSATVSGDTVTAASFTAQNTTLHSDQGGRDEQVQGRILQTDTYPTTTFTLSSPLVMSTLADGKTGTGTAQGRLMLHGVTKEVTFTVQAKRSGASIAVTGSIPIHFADYSIDNPSGGPAQTGDDGTLEFLLTLTKS